MRIWRAAHIWEIKDRKFATVKTLQQAYTPEAASTFFSDNWIRRRTGFHAKIGTLSHVHGKTAVDTRAMGVSIYHGVNLFQQFNQKQDLTGEIDQAQKTQALKC